MRNIRKLAELIKIKERLRGMRELSSIDITPLLGKAFVRLKGRTDEAALDMMIRSFRAIRDPDIIPIGLESVEEVKEYLEDLAVSNRVDLPDPLV